MPSSYVEAAPSPNRSDLRSGEYYANCYRISDVGSGWRNRVGLAQANVILDHLDDVGLLLHG
jgi:hypothetical protein